MKKFFMKSRRNIVALFMSALTAVFLCNPATAFAAEATQAEVTEYSMADSSIQPRAGVEPLPMGIYFIGGFTFTDTNLSPVKTVAGSKVSFSISFKKAARDAGLGNVKLKFQVRDINGNALSPVYEKAANTDGSLNYLNTEYINLGYPGRQIQLWMDASSTGQSNGNFRSIEINNVCSFVE